ncbi:MAG: glutathione S-transferase family protein [Reyranella sp.]|nr:glutathione S-transferase family protein [Reyranella sp.]
MLEEIGCPYKTVVKEFGPDMKSPDYLALNPMGKVPTIKHGDTVVTETGAILCYLADAFPEAKLAPPVGQRGGYYRWLFFVAGCCDPAMSNKATGWNPPPELERRFGYGSYERTMDTVAKVVDGKRTIAADHFTAADLYMASFLYWGMMFDTIEKKPAFEAYVAPHMKRPAAIRADEKAKHLAAKSG